MSFQLKPGKVFLQQITTLNQQEKDLIGEKLKRIKINPFRNKSLTVKGMTKVFEIKITLGGIYKRVIYTIEGNEIQIEGILNRKNNFEDLVKIIYKNRQD